MSCCFLEPNAQKASTVVAVIELALNFYAVVQCLLKTSCGAGQSYVWLRLFGFLASIVLLYGTRERMRYLMLPWLIFSCLRIVFSAYIFYIGIANSSGDATVITLVSVWYILVLAVVLTCTFIVINAFFRMGATNENFHRHVDEEEENPVTAISTIHSVDT